MRKNPYAKLYDSQTAQVSDVKPMSPAALHKARLVLASHCDDAQDLADMMRMLGLFPGQTEGLDVESDEPGSEDYSDSSDADGFEMYSSEDG